MSSPLKFIAYHFQCGIFEPDFINKDGSAVGCPPGSMGNITSRDVMQYSVVNDKNGNPIYSGHIIRAYDKTWKVIFSQGCFVAVQHRHMRALRMMYCEIIGNVFQNRHLIINEVKTERVNHGNNQQNLSKDGMRLTAQTSGQPGQGPID